MKTPSLLLLFVFAFSSIYAQSYSQHLDKELSFASTTGFNLVSKILSRPDLGADNTYIVIKTNIPIQDENGMTSVSVNYWGYEYNFELTVGWYSYYGGFYSPNAQVTGISNLEEVSLFEENGKVCIGIPKTAFSIYGSITVHKKVGGIIQSPDWQKNWEIKDAIDINGKNKRKQITVYNSGKTSGNNFALSNLKFNESRTHDLNNKNISLMYGKVGIGTQDPDQALVVDGKISFKYDDGKSYNGIYRESTRTLFYNNITSTPTNLIYQFNGSQGKTVLTMTQGGFIKIPGKLSIGNSDVTEAQLGNFHLAVDGKIGAREIEVKEGNWADYVFDENYKLMPLEEVAQYVKTNKHLPNVPSAQEVKEEGLSLGEMTRIQQEKIEELLLYILQQQEQFNELKEQIQALQMQ